MMSEMKKRLQRKGARKGFTLVELLIVIIIIGILAGAMMLVAGTSRDTAEASRIISDLRTVKSAAVMWMADSPTSIDDKAWTDLNDDPSPLNKYLDRVIDPEKTKLIFATGMVKIKFNISSDDPTDYETKEQTAWLLGYDLGDVRSGVKDRLEGQASSAGLYGGPVAEDAPITIDLTTNTPQYFIADDEAVYVIVQ